MSKNHISQKHVMFVFIVCIVVIGAGSEGTDQCAHVPHFLSPSETVSLSKNHVLSESVYHVKAVDEDESDCASPEHCPCADITYSIVNTEDNGGVFQLESKTGELFLKRHLDYPFVMHLVLAAENNGINGYGKTGSEMTLIIEAYSEVFSRHKRSDQEYMTATAGADEVTIYVSKNGTNETITELSIGSSIDLQVAIHFPVGETDMLVELFTEDNMMICGAEIIACGGDLDVCNLALPPTMAYDLPNRTRVVIDLGNVTNDGAYATASPGSTDAFRHEMIIIEFRGVMVENDSLCSLSAGAEYNQSEMIFVATANCIFNSTSIEVPDSPLFNYTGPEEIASGTAATFKIEMCIPYISSQLKVSAFAPLNDSTVMIMCSMMVSDMGDDYSCLQKMDLTDESSEDQQIVILDLGTVINTDEDRNFTTDTEKSCITVIFTVLVSSSAEPGTVVWVGAAVEIGLTQIWAAQSQVTIVANRTITCPDTNPEVALTPKSGTNTTIGGVVQYEVNITLPHDSESKVDLEILSAYNNSAARMKICKVEMIAQGANIPCFHETQPLLTSTDGSTDANRAVWSFGTLLNNNGRQLSEDAYASTITVKVTAQVLNHSMNDVGAKLWLTVGVTVCSDILWVSSTSLCIEESTIASDPPDFNLSISDGGDTLIPGEPTDLLLSITLKSIHDLNLEFLTPVDNGTAIMKICKAEIMSSGLNLPCFDRVTANSSITYESRYGDGENSVMDKAVANFNEVCVVKDIDDNSTTEDNIVIRLIVQLLEHAQLGEANWVSAGVGYSNVNIWVGQASITAVTDLETCSGGDTPYVDYNRTDAEDDIIYDGMTATYTITLKIPCGCAANVTLTVTAGSGLSICLVRVKEIGENYQCLTADILGNYTEHPGSYYSESVDLHLGIVKNLCANDTDVARNGTFDADTIAFEVIVYNFGSPVGAQNFQYDIDGLSISEAISWTATATAFTTDNVTMPSFNISLEDMNGNFPTSMSRAETVLLSLDIYLANGSNNNLVVKFLTPVNKTGAMEISAAYVVYVGKNIPCLKKQEIVPEYSSRPGDLFNYSSIATLDLGRPCHSEIYDDENEDNRRITLTAAFTLRFNGSEETEELPCSVTVKIEDSQLYVGQVGIEADDSFTPTPINCTNEDNVTRITADADTLYWSPNEIYNVALTLNVPANFSERGYMVASVPCNESCIATVENIVVVASGPNVPVSSQDVETDDTPNSYKNTSQNDSTKKDFIVLSNTGITFKAGTFDETTDNNLDVNVTIRMADALLAENNTEFWINFGLSIGDECIYLYEMKITAIRDETEEQDIALEVVNLNSTYLDDSNEAIMVSAHLEHTNLSKAEGYNVSANFYFPYYLSYCGLLYSNFSFDEIQLTSGVQFKADRFFFTDIAYFEFCLKRNDTNQPSTNTAFNTSITYTTETSRIARGDVSEPDTWKAAYLERLSVAIIGPGGEDNQGCDAIPLGMENGKIQDCQIKGSNHPTDEYGPLNARYGGSSGFELGARSYTKRPDASGDYSYGSFVQVNFGNSTKVTRITITHPTAPYFDDHSHIGTLRTYYSFDNINWVLGEDKSLPAYTTGSVTVNLTSTMDSTFFRMEILTDTDSTALPAFQAEFHGCTVTSDKTVEQACNEHKTSWTNNITQYPYKSFLVKDSTFYVCDVDAADEKMRSKCFFSVDGTTHNSIDDRVITILGFSSDTNELCGIAWDKRSVVCSTDEGDTWYSVPKSHLEELKSDSATWEDALNVLPIRDGPTFDVGSTNTPYTFPGSNKKACYGGIVEGSTTVVNFDTCCN